VVEKHECDCGGTAPFCKHKLALLQHIEADPKPEKKATPKKEATATSGKQNPFGKARPFQRLNHTQAIWTNPPEGKHPFLP
jgi:hypothetical protein